VSLALPVKRKIRLSTVTEEKSPVESRRIVKNMDNLCKEEYKLSNSSFPPKKYKTRKVVPVGNR
jgi:hypothetical protein